MDMIGIETKVKEVRRLFEDRMGIRGRSLERQLRKAGRLLPKAVQREARFLVEARSLMQNPKLARMIDPGQVERAHHRVITHLLSIDPKDVRKGKLLNMLGLLSFQLIVIVVIVVSVLVWRGFL